MNNETSAGSTRGSSSISTVIRLNASLRALALPEHKSHNKESKLRELAIAIYKAGPVPEENPPALNVD
eukprot:13437469-Heterocapsa_arctica.AAC.1